MLSFPDIGGVAEWLKAPVSKTGIRETGSRVQISPPPPDVQVRTVIIGYLTIT